MGNCALYLLPILCYSWLLKWHVVLFRRFKVKLLTAHSYIRVIHYLQERFLLFSLNNLYPHPFSNFFLNRHDLSECVYAVSV